MSFLQRRSPYFKNQSLIQIQAITATESGQGSEAVDILVSTNLTDPVSSSESILEGNFIVVTESGLFEDNFDDNTYDSIRWPTRYQSGSTTTTEQNNRLEISFPSSATSAALGGYESAVQYNFAGREIYCEIIQVPAVGTTANGELLIFADANNKFRWVIESGTLYAQSWKNNVKTTHTSFTYNSTTHRWWRIRENSGTIYWDTSPDGFSWTNQATFAHGGMNLSTVGIEIDAYCYQNETNPGGFIIGSLGSSISISNATETAAMVFACNIVDTDNGSEVATVFASISDTDSGILSDFLLINAGIIAQDAGVLIPEILSLLTQISFAESGNLSDSIAIYIVNDILLPDSGTHSDTVTIFADVIVLDSGVSSELFDIVSRALVSENGSDIELLDMLSSLVLSESVGMSEDILIFTQAIITELSSGNETEAITNNFSLTDSGTDSDLIETTTALILQDTAILLETIFESVTTNVPDSNIFAIENAVLFSSTTLSESALSSELLELSINFILNEIGASIEQISLFMALALSEYAVAAETISALILFTLNENSSSTETIVILAGMILAESALNAELLAVLIFAGLYTRRSQLFTAKSNLYNRNTDGLYNSNK